MLIKNQHPIHVFLLAAVTFGAFAIGAIKAKTVFAASLTSYHVSFNPSAPSVNQPTEIDFSVNVPNQLNDAIVDAEIYDSGNNKIFQQYFDHQNLTGNTDLSYKANWIPKNVGSYQLKLGIFQSNWSATAYWENNAATVTVKNPAARSVPNNQITVSVNPSLAAVGQPLPLTVSVSPASSISDGIVDVEAYQGSSKVWQQFFEHQNLTAGQNQNFTAVWTPSSAGSYQIKAGLFAANWTSNSYWNDNVAAVTIGAAVAPSPALATPTPAASLSTSTLSATSTAGYTTGNGQIYRNGQIIQLHGISWFGFENAGTQVAHGLWARNWLAMIGQIKQLGFNAVRVPVCPNTLKNDPVSSIDYSLNPDLKNLNSLDLLDKFVTEMSRQNLYVLLDMHTQNCQNISDTWLVPGYSQQQWTSDLQTMAKRYANVPNFIGIDLKNEPHGSATWGTGDLNTDWKAAAETAGSAVLAANPNLLVFVEGIEQNPTCSNNSVGHFWGGNFEPVNCSPINNSLIPADKIVYSPHVYGPDVYSQPYFNDASFPGDMTQIWNTQFGFLKDQGKTIAIGEWGGKYGTGDPKDKTWQDAFSGYLSAKGICNSFYWSFNPNSGDTGGILNDDWTTVRTDKVQMLQKYFASCH